MLEPVRRSESTNPLREYRLLGIRLDGGGPFHRETRLGSQIVARSLSMVKTGDFIYSRLYAWRGAFGLISPNLDGCYVSGEFPTFKPIPSKIDAGFLLLWFRLPETISKVEAVCTGSTPLTRNRFKEHFFLNMEIPLPSLEEQRRIVARIEEVTDKLEEVNRLRIAATEETEKIFTETRRRIFEEAIQEKSQRLDTAVILERGRFSHRPRNEPRFFGGVHPWIQIEEIEASNKYIRNWTQTLNDDGLAISRKFPKGTVLISIAATIGAVGILDFDCCVPDSIVAVTPKEGTDSEFVYFCLGYLRTHLEEIAPQSAQKNINLRILAPLPIPDLPFAEQRRIVVYLNNLQAKVEDLKRLQAETSIELNVLLPSILDEAFKAQP